MEALAARHVRALRLKKGLSQQALAAKIGVSHQMVQKYETGSRIPPGRLAQIAGALGTTPAALLADRVGQNDEVYRAFLRIENARRIMTLVMMMKPELHEKAVEMLRVLSEISFF